MQNKNKKTEQEHQKLLGTFSAASHLDTADFEIRIQKLNAFEIISDNDTLDEISEFFTEVDLEVK